MCFDLDSRPPIAPIAGGALDSSELTLETGDGNRFRAFRARAADPSGAAILVLPDVRGLHPYYEELALRFAENGVDALAIDWFGRTAGTSERGDGFEYMPHVNQTRWDDIVEDIRAGVAAIRADGRAASVFTIGFCFGGRVSFDAATLGFGLAGAVGFYGIPAGEYRSGIPAPTEVANDIECPVLGIFGGSDRAISAEMIRGFEEALDMANIEHQVVVEPGAPHSFFDRKAEEFADASGRAWTTTLEFVRSHTGAPAGAG
jgi:carboxymethylenebutenolidase